AIVRDMRFVFANSTYLKMYGFGSVEELMASGTADQRIAPHERERILRPPAERAPGTPAPPWYEMDTVRKDGSQFRAMAASRAIEWDGQPASLVSVFDVTEQRTLERSLRLKDHAIGSASEAIAFGELSGKIVEVNPAFARLYGLASPAEAVGRRGVEFLWTPE